MFNTWRLGQVRDTKFGTNVSNEKPLNLYSAQCVLKIFDNMNVISLYWITLQQQTSTFRQQTFDLFYPEFSAELNDLTLNV